MAETRYKENILKRNIHPEQGIGQAPEHKPENLIYQTIALHKWSNFCAHSRNFSPIMVLDTTETKDEHSLFAKDVDDVKLDLLMEDLCVEGAFWSGANVGNYTMY
ncbi:hypothetical protein V6N12_060926 [Hibiscus sabdariffa]|uniref:Uncharacterized protein n=1 Tax=Hibiscus sabdariffa TaxID=183260 RepID=A0ABR2DYZ4_9ROSI